MNETRKLAVIMFSDVVGYTAMMGTDEAATLAIVQKYQKIQKSLILNYRGTVVKEIGDGLLAYFPDSESAVTCCIEIQKKLKDEPDFNVRIGLHKADILLVNGDIFGDGVNIASRIESLADPGGIYVSAEVADSLSEASRIGKVLMGKAKLKNVKVKLDVYAIQGEYLPTPSKNRFDKLANPSRKLAMIPAILIFLVVLTVIITSTVNYFNNEALKEETRNSLGEIEKLVKSSWRDYGQAYDLAMEANRIIPDDPRLRAIIEKSSIKINVNSEPEGAHVYIKKYNMPDAPWEEVGITPIDSLRLPISVYRWRLEKEGYETVLAVATTFDWKDISDMRKSNLFTASNFFRTLDKTGTIPEKMTRVNGAQMPYGKLDDFLIDKYEVTNYEFKKFIDAGGYTNKEYWIEKFIKDGKELNFEEVGRLFVDKTGQPGPATWENGTYPSNEDNYPVTGVSWFEAKAYAKFVNKDLPTGDHWGLARGENTFIIRWPQMGGYALFAPFSNFNHFGSVEVGSLEGITSFGAYDMAGNVNEWCFNDTQIGKLIRGGSWSSNTYMFGSPMQAPPLDRSETNGFRCVKYLSENPMPPTVYEPRLDIEIIIANAELPEPVNDEIFKVYRTFYEYDRTDLNPFIEFRKDKAEWVHEKVIFDAAYNNEKIIAHIFLPKNAQPPFQSVVYGPGSASFFQLNSDSIESYYEFPIFLEHFIKNGRAVIYPVVQGTFERRNDQIASIHLGGSDTQQYTEFITQVIKDYRRTIDYLETRDDFDSDKIAFYGMSWGPFIGSILTAVDDRIKTNIFISGGLRVVGRPEVNQINFITRVKIPTLMVNGRYDSIIPFNSSIEPLYQGIAVNDNEKKLVLFDTDHIPPREGMISESLSWLDQQLGQVEMKSGPI